MLTGGSVGLGVTTGLSPVGLGVDESMVGGGTGAFVGFGVFPGDAFGGFVGT